MDSLVGESSSTLMPLYSAMTQKTSPKVAGAVQARLVYLHRRKVLLDELIQSLEKYCRLEYKSIEENGNHLETQEKAGKAGAFATSAACAW